MNLAGSGQPSSGRHKTGRKKAAGTKRPKEGYRHKAAGIRLPAQNRPKEGCRHKAGRKKAAGLPAFTIVHITHNNLYKLYFLFLYMNRILVYLRFPLCYNVHNADLRELLSTSFL